MIILLIPLLSLFDLLAIFSPFFFVVIANQALSAEAMIFFSSSVISGAYFLIAREVHPLIFLISPLT